MKGFYRAILLWALHQGLGTVRGDKVYAFIGPIIDLVIAGQESSITLPVISPTTPTA